MSDVNNINDNEDKSLKTQLISILHEMNIFSDEERERERERDSEDEEDGSFKYNDA